MELSERASNGEPVGRLAKGHQTSNRGAPIDDHERLALLNRSEMAAQPSLEIRDPDALHDYIMVMKRS